MTRAQKMAAVRRMRAAGKTYREIEETLGVKRGTAWTWVFDADGRRARARRASYAGKCVDCGGATHGSNGPGKAPPRCAGCTRKHKTANRKWTRERIIAWIQLYVETFGEVPPSTVQSSRWTETTVNFKAPPTTADTAREFGKQPWATAVRAAGYEPRNPRVGESLRLGRSHPVSKETVSLYKKGWTLEEIGELHRVTGGAVGFRLEALGVARRSPAESRALKALRRG